MQRKNISKAVAVKNASHLKIGIVVSDYYSEEVTQNLLSGAEKVLAEWSVQTKNISVVHVPGSFEIPYGCISLLKKKKYNALITLGCIIKGETDHDKHIAGAITQGIMDLILAYKIPIGLGVLTVNTLKQAKARSTGKNNKGEEAAHAVLECTFL